MRRPTFIAATFAVIANIIALPAVAYIITVDPDFFAPGTDISKATPGVRLATFTTDGRVVGHTGTVSPTWSPVYAAEDPNCFARPEYCGAPTWSRTFSPFVNPETAPYSDWLYVVTAASCLRGGLSCSEQFRAMVISFDQPTDYVELSGTYYEDYSGMLAFDSSFNPIGFSLDGGTFVRPRWDEFEYGINNFSIQTEQPLIAHVLAGGVLGLGGLDALRFNLVPRSVPEPGALVLFCIGLGILRVAKRRNLS